MPRKQPTILKGNHAVKYNDSGAIDIDYYEEKLNMESRQAIDFYCAFRRMNNYDYVTVKNGRTQLMEIAVFLYLERENRAITKMTTVDFVCLYSWYAYQGHGGASRFNAIRDTYSLFVLTIKRVDPVAYGDVQNVARALRTVKKKQHRKFYPVPKDICEDILEFCCNAHDFKRACFFALLMYSSMPISAIMRFRVQYVAPEYLVGDCIYRTNVPIRVEGGKSYMGAVLAAPFRPYFDAWMLQRENMKIDSPWLFPTPTNPKKPMKKETGIKWIRDTAQYLELEEFLGRTRFFGMLCEEIVRLGIGDRNAEKVFTTNKAALLELLRCTRSRVEFDDSFEDEDDEEGGGNDA